jgi:hypothetical protein
MKKKGKSVVVTDTHRGIVWGYLADTLEDGNAVRLEGARHCFYYAANNDAEHRGIFGLATQGPKSGSKIGPRVNMVVRDVAKVIECTKEATKAWESSKWGS